MSVAEAQTFYITAAIDYPNGPPHIGHSFEKIAADVIARFHRLIGEETRFCMGLDENSQHIVRAANDNCKTPQAWTDEIANAFVAAWDALYISRDSWVRTTEPRHWRASEELFLRAQANGDIYKAKYAGWYCPNCNTYYNDNELVKGRCPNHPTLAPEWLEEENYFFALSKYTDRLLAHFAENPEFVTPTGWRPEMIGLLESGLRDFSVSRQARGGAAAWGIPVPGDPEHVLYVWFDALTTYITAIGFPDDMDTFNRFWPADSHVIGKDITRFHCLYWPAMLMAAGVPLPKRIVVHGFMTLEGQRISKTTGNTIDPIDLVNDFGADPIRYYLMRDVSFASDGDFSRANLIRRHNDDLGNDLGNLLNRVVSMIGRYRGGVVPGIDPAVCGEPEAALQRIAVSARNDAEQAFRDWQINVGIDSVWTLVRRANQYLEERKPWTLAKDPANAALLDATLASAAEATRLAAIYLAGVMPATSDRIMAQLGLPPVRFGEWTSRGSWGTSEYGTVAPAGPLFPRIEAETPV